MKNVCFCKEFPEIHLLYTIMYSNNKHKCYILFVGGCSMKPSTEIKLRYLMKVLTQPPFHYGFGRIKVIIDGFRMIDDMFMKAEKRVKDEL